MTRDFITMWFAGALGALALGSVTAAGAQGLELKQAIELALESNPEINQAVQNREAVEFEREQAQGLYWPRVSVEASAGLRYLQNYTRRSLGIADDTLNTREVAGVAEWTLYDFGKRRAELHRQAARTDGASLRVGERSEYVALQIARQYMDLLLQQSIVAESRENIDYHRKFVNDLRHGVSGGSISIADQQQAEERLHAAESNLAEAQEELNNVILSLRTLTGVAIDQVGVPPALRSKLPAKLDDALAATRTSNPMILEAVADLDAANALVDAAKAELLPTLGAEVRARTGSDLDGFRGHTNDVHGRFVLRWDLDTAGINRSKIQEMVRRASEARYHLDAVSRKAEEDIGRAWNRWTAQGKVLSELERESKVLDDLLVSYREQFNVSRRSLLDVLNAQNTRYNVRIRTETARYSEAFAEYQILAASYQLLSTLGIARPDAADPYARERYEVAKTPPAERYWRRDPADRPKAR